MPHTHTHTSITPYADAHLVLKDTFLHPPVNPHACIRACMRQAIIGPLVYARLYAYGSKRGMPGLHYGFVGVLCFLTELFGRSTIAS